MENRKRKSIGTVIYLLLVLAIIISSTTIGIFSYFKYKNNVIKLNGERAEAIAQTISLTIDGDKFRYYDESGKTDEYYEKVKAYLSEIRNKNELTYVYSMVDADEKYKYIISGYSKDEDQSEWGYLGYEDSKEIYSEELIKTFKNGESIYTDPLDYGENYGPLVSGFAPIYDSNAKIAGVVGVDIAVSKQLEKINKIIPLLILMVFGTSSILFAVSYFAMRKQIILPIHEITEKSKTILEGDSDIGFNQSYLKRQDEIGMLSNAFFQIASNIKDQALLGEKIAAGNLDIEIKPRSDKDIMAISMASVVGTLKNLVKEATRLNEAAMEGNLDERADANEFEGAYKDIVLGMNNTLEGILNPLEVAKAFIIGLADGTQMEFIPDAESYKGYYGELIRNLNNVLESLFAMLKEVTQLTEQAISGNLSHRADLSKLQGGYSQIVGGINDTIESLIKPLNVLSDYAEKIGVGELPSKITEEYKGDFNRIKESINSCVEGFEGLVEGSAVLEKMSLNDYTIKVEGEYKGIYKILGDSINLLNYRMNRIVEILTHVSNGDLSDRENIIEGGKRSEKDTLVPALINMTQNIQAVIDETINMAKAVADGELEYRSNQEEFKGKWQELVIGINRIMEEVAKPLADVTTVMDKISNGILGVSISNSYSGEFEKLADAVNNTAYRLNVVVGEIASILKEVAEGNLAIENIREYRGDFEIISYSLNVIIESLNSVLGEINMAADQVSLGSKQVSEGSQALSQGTTEQASSIEELTASISEVASKTKENAVNAGRANEMTIAVKESAELGNKQMKTMLGAMKNINEASNDISKIIKVIDDIAFQTNILALNAAVEAARAGQHGKGFAVVAEEVRNLAARSASAAKETSDLIQGSIEKVAIGTEIANNTAIALENIVDGVSKTAEIISEISNSSNNQAMGISQINAGLNQISQVVQTNAATAEESAASSEELSGQATMLKEMVGKFNLNNNNNESINYLSLTDAKPIVNEVN